MADDEKELPRCRLVADVECRGDGCSACPFAKPEEASLGKANRLVERGRPYAYAVALVAIILLLIWHEFFQG